MNARDGGPAFPIALSEAIARGCVGMSLRDYFAAKAMQGELSTQTEENHIERGRESDVALKAYAIADAMLSARGESNAQAAAQGYRQWIERKGDRRAS